MGSAVPALPAPFFFDFCLSFRSAQLLSPLRGLGDESSFVTEILIVAMGITSFFFSAIAGLPPRSFATSEADEGVAGTWLGYWSGLCCVALSFVGWTRARPPAPHGLLLIIAVRREARFGIGPFRCGNHFPPASRRNRLHRLRRDARRRVVRHVVHGKISALLAVAG